MYHHCIIELNNDASDPNFVVVYACVVRMIGNNDSLLDREIFTLSFVLPNLLLLPYSFYRMGFLSDRR